ncbi:MAG: hypothetical protein IJF52_06900 [Clostridia bacterium]|nr:hypothetical protein [Clostridia bacterium]
MQTGFPSDSGKYPKEQKRSNDANINICIITYAKNDLEETQDSNLKNHKKALELLEEAERIKQKKVLFYCLIAFLGFLFVSALVMMFTDRVVFGIILFCIFMFLVGILIVYFISKKNKEDHYLLNFIFNFINDIIVRIFGY